MFTREKYCAVCGCLFSLPDIRDPVNPDPDEDPLLPYGDPYDSRILPRELTEWLTDYRVVGRCAAICSTLANVSTCPDLFISQPAIWRYGWDLEPVILTTAGEEAPVEVYELIDGTSDIGMFFPIHKACLDILQRLCQIRQAQDQAPSSEIPKTLDAFCDALRQRRWRNQTKPDKSRHEDRYYARRGGIEWPHDYYGPRQFWTDEWDTEPGWEFLCADPSPTKIPDLAPYLLSELPKSPSTGIAQDALEKEVAERLGWLFPEEVDTVLAMEAGSIDWEKGIENLSEKADMISADEGGEDEGKKRLASAPLGLKNRWRIWKILQGIRVE